MNLGPKDASEIAVMYPESQPDAMQSVFSQIVDLPVVKDYRHQKEEALATLANIQLTQLEAGNPGAIASPLYQAPMENPLHRLQQMASLATYTGAANALRRNALANNKPMTPPGLLKAPGYLAQKDQPGPLPFHPGIIENGKELKQYGVYDKANAMESSAVAQPVVKPKLFQWVPDRFFPKFKPHPANIVHPLLRFGR